MASDVDIVNLALSRLGDTATVTSISPPEGSVQAEHAARFYSSSLAAILELHPWSFSTTRAALAYTDNPTSTWGYAYAVPSDVLNFMAVLDPAATADYSASIANAPLYTGIGTIPSQGYYTPQPFILETDAEGDDILLTNQEDAVLIYTRMVTDTSKFSPLFVQAFAMLLASKLAGPIIKGMEGAKMAQACLQEFNFWFGKAIDSDASQRVVKPTQQVAWMNAR